MPIILIPCSFSPLKYQNTDSTEESLLVVVYGGNGGIIAISCLAWKLLVVGVASCVSSLYFYHCYSSFVLTGLITFKNSIYISVRQDLHRKEG